ncbi:acyltransferase [Nanoarchaeota archaeon]
MSFKKHFREIAKKVLKDKSIRVVKIKYTGKRGNAECDWHKVRNPVWTMFTAFVFTLLRYSPPTNLKNWIYRRFGAKIGKDVAIAYNCFLDPLYPELIEIGDNTLVGSDCEIATHEIVNNYWTLGRCKIGKNCMIGAFSLIGAGQVIGDNVILGLRSFVNKPIPSNQFWGGSPAKLIKEIGVNDLKLKEDVEISRYED